MSWLSGYDYRKSITLSRVSGAVSNYQMKLLLGESSGAIGEDVDCGGHCLSTFNDIRFTTSDGTTMLDYWIESVTGTTPNQLATIWIEFDYIGTSATTFYMYYGKADATAGSNGSNTFLFFDDFARENSDTVGNGWTESVDVFSIENGTLKNINPSNSDAERRCYKSFSSWGSSFCFEARTKLPELVASHSVVTELVNNGNQRMVLGIEKTSVRYFLNTWVSIDTNSGDWIILGSIFDSVNTKAAYAVNRTIKASNVSLASASGYQNTIGITTYWRSSLSYVDWVLVRQYLATEPAWGSWGTQENEGSEIIEAAEATDEMVGISMIESTSESAVASDAMVGIAPTEYTTESAEATDTFGNERTSYGPTTESAEVTDSMDALHLVDSITESAIVSGSMEAAEIIRKRVRFPNLQGKHLSLKFTSATDGSFAIYYLRHKMFKTRELTSDQKHPNTQGSHIGIKLSNSGTDDFTLMYVSQKMQLVTT